MNVEDFTVRDLLRIATARGFTIVVKPGSPPMPVLRDPGGQIPPPTEPLLEALRVFREDIIAELTKS